MTGLANAVELGVGVLAGVCAQTEVVAAAVVITEAVVMGAIAVVLGEAVVVTVLPTVLTRVVTVEILSTLPVD